MISLDTFLSRLGVHRTASHALWKADRLMSPTRDWFVLLTIFVGIVFCLLAAGGSLFLGVSRGDLYVTGPGEAPRTDTVDRSALREILLFFEGQSAEFSELRASPPSVSSPL